MAFITGIPIRNSIHTDLSTDSGDWNTYRGQLTGQFISGGGANTNRYGEFTNDIREYNRKIDTLTGHWGHTGLFLTPHDAGFRYTGTGDFTASPVSPPVTSQSFVIPFRKTAFYETHKESTSKRFYGEFDDEHNDGLNPTSSLNTSRKGKSGGSRNSSITLGDVRLSDSDFSAGGRHFDEVEFGVDSTRSLHFPGYYGGTTMSRGQYFSAVIFHFSNITVKQGATISSAKLKVNKSTPTSGSDQGEAVKIAAIFGDDSDFTRIPNKRRTAVTWHNFYVLSEDTQLESPDISSIIQEIVNLATWQSGNDISLYMFYEAGGSQSSYNNHDTIPAQTLLKVKSGYDSSGNVTTSEAPTLEITSDGGSDFSGTIIEAAESKRIRRVENVSVGGGQKTFNNSGASPTILNNSSSIFFGRIRSEFSPADYYNDATITFRGFILRFPNIPLAQGATVPTTRLSIVVARDTDADPANSEDVNFVDGTRNFNRSSSDDLASTDSHHDYSTGNHALNGDGTNDLVGVRVRAIKVTDVDSSFTGIDASHPSGLTATGGNTTDAFVDIPLDSIFPLDFVGSLNGKGKKTREGDRIETPDMKAILQEIVDQGGWSENNAIALLFYLPQVHSDSAVEGTTTPRKVIANFFLGSTIHHTKLSHYSNIESNSTQFSGRASSEKKIVGKTPKLLIGD